MNVSKLRDDEVRSPIERLLRFLEKRYKAPVPGDLAAVIQATEDTDLLMRWVDAAAEANTFDDFRAATQLRS